MTNKEMTRPMTPISLVASRLAIVAVVSYQLLLIALIFIRPDLDPYWHTLSEWALEPHGWIMSMAFLISATSYGSMLVAVRSQVRGVPGAIGFGILLICTIGTVGVGVFTTDPFDTPRLSTTGMLHIISGLSALMLFPFAALLINLSLALSNPSWASVRRLMIWTAFLPLAGLVGFIVHLSIFVIPLGDNAHGPGVPLGWPARFLFLTYMVWLIVLACQLIKLSKGSSSPSGNRDEFVRSLLVKQPAPELGDQALVYGWLIGSWDVTVVDYQSDGSKRETAAEWHFSWALEGRAVMDTFICPRRTARTSHLAKLGNRYGVTVRIYDPNINAWRIRWINPVTGAYDELVVTRNEEVIMQEGRDHDGNPFHWVFTDITPESFRWFSERSRDSGKTWIMEAEFFTKRRAAIA